MTQMFLSLLLLFELHMSGEAQRMSPSQILLEQQKKEKFHLKYLHINSQWWEYVCTHSCLEENNKRFNNSEGYIVISENIQL